MNTNLAIAIAMPIATRQGAKEGAGAQMINIEGGFGFDGGVAVHFN